MEAFSSGLWTLVPGVQVAGSKRVRPKYGGVEALDSALETKDALDPPVIRQAGQGASHFCSHDWDLPVVQTAPSSQEARAKCRTGLW